MVPGRIQLYDQPKPPWDLPASLPRDAATRLERAGARVHDGVGRSTVHWPGESLRVFFLFDVLLHELGHHRVQHETGKRQVRTMRTRDHEQAASLWAERWRSVLLPWQQSR